MLESLVITPVFILFSVWWWVLVSVTLLFSLIFVANEKFAVGWVPLLFLFGGLIVFGDPNITISWWTVLWGVLGYIICGTAWGIIKWYLFVSRRYSLYKEALHYWLSSRDLTEVPDELLADFRTYLRLYDEVFIDLHYDTLKLIPNPQDYKHKILGWMTYWPLSLFWTVCSDFIIRLFDIIRVVCIKLMTSISEWVFKGVDERFK